MFWRLDLLAYVVWPKETSNIWLITQINMEDTLATKKPNIICRKWFPFSKESTYLGAPLLTSRIQFHPIIQFWAVFPSFHLDEQWKTRQTRLIWSNIESCGCCRFFFFVWKQFSRQFKTVYPHSLGTMVPCSRCLIRHFTSCFSCSFLLLLLLRPRQGPSLLHDRCC